MFTPESRAALREELIARAERDERVVGAALTGSAATGGEDSWSDVDLMLSVAEGIDRDEVLADWTTRMYAEHGTVDHLDVHAGPAVYRVFLQADTLQVDISFWPAAEFSAMGPKFKLLFGTAQQRQAKPQDPRQLIGIAWLYALHARSSIERGRVWQAEYMIGTMRDQVLALACRRHGVPETDGRGMDDLPPQARPIEMLARGIDLAELRRAFRAVTEGLIREAREVDAAYAQRIEATVRELAG